MLAAVIAVRVSKARLHLFAQSPADALDVVQKVVGTSQAALPVGPGERLGPARVGSDVLCLRADPGREYGKSAFRNALGSVPPLQHCLGNRQGTGLDASDSQVSQS